MRRNKRETQVLAAVYKLLPPTSRKRHLLDRAISDYRRASMDLLAWAETNMDRLRREAFVTRTDSKGKERVYYSAISVGKLLPTVDTGDIHSSLAESMYSDIAARLASFLMLEAKGEDVSFPLSQQHIIPDHDTWLAEANDPELDYPRWENDERLLKWGRKRQRRIEQWGLLFCRADAARNNRCFALLRNEAGDLKLLAYLFSQGSGVLPRIKGNGDLYDIGTGERWTRNSQCALILPLYRDRHPWLTERFRGGQPKSCHLFKKGRDYFAAVSYVFEVPPAFEPEGEIQYEVINIGGNDIQIKRDGWISPDRGFWARMASIRADRHQKQERFRDISNDRRESAQVKEWLYTAVNHLVASSLQGRSQIVVKGGGRRMKELINVLNSRLALAGAPRARWIKKEILHFSVKTDTDPDGGIDIVATYGGKLHMSSPQGTPKGDLAQWFVNVAAPQIVDLAIKTDRRIAIDLADLNEYVRGLITVLNDQLAEKDMSRVKIIKKKEPNSQEKADPQFPTIPVC